MAFKPVGVDENSRFPARVEEALSATVSNTAKSSALASAADAEAIRVKNSKLGPIIRDGQGYLILELLSDRRTLVGRKNTDSTNGPGALGISTDKGATWTAVKTWPTEAIKGFLLLDNGEVIVNTAYPSNNRLYKSSGFASNPATATWTMVRAYAGGSNHNAHEYHAMAKGPSGVLYIADYGAKTNTSAGVNAAVRVLKSTNNGDTWSNVFRLDNWLASRGHDVAAIGFHLHSVAYDKWWDRVWVSYGDYSSGVGEAGVIYSDDAGVNWDIAYTTGTTGGQFQSVGIIPTADAIVLMPDGNPSGVAIIKRLPGKKISAPSQALNLSASYSAIGQAASTPLSDNDPIFAAVSQQNTSAQISGIVVFGGGLAVNSFYKDTAGFGAFAGMKSVVGPTSEGKVLASVQQDSRFASGTTTLEFDLIPYQQKFASGSVAPTTVPTYIGQGYVDTVTKKVYFATGTASSSDWTLVN